MGKGIDVRATGSELIVRAAWNDGATIPAPLSAGSATIRVIELQNSDASVKGYDFNSNTFKTTALTTPTLSLTERTTDNSTYHTGIWTARISTLSGFTAGNIYIVIATHSTAGVQWTQFQFGSVEGDLAVVTSSGVDYLKSDVEFWNGTSVATGVTMGALTVNGNTLFAGTGSDGAIVITNSNGPLIGLAGNSGNAAINISGAAAGIDFSGNSIDQFIRLSNCPALVNSFGTVWMTSCRNTGTTTLSGNATLGGALTVTGGTTLSTLQVTGTTAFAGISAGLLSMTGFSNSGAMTQTGNVSLGGTLTVTGGTTLSTLTTGAVTHSTLQVTGTTVLNGLSAGLLTMTGFSNSGAMTQTGNVSLGGTLTVTGATTLNGLSAGLLQMSGFSNSGAMTQTGNVSLGGTLTVTGATTLAGFTAGAVQIASFNNLGATTYVGAITANSTSNNWNGTLANVTNVTTVASTTTIGGTGLGAIDTQLTGTHGTGSWQSGGGGTDAAAIAAALASMNVIAISVYGPATGQTLNLFRADTYQSAQGSGRAVTITKDASETHWPDTLSTVHFTCKPTAETLDDASSAASLTDVACTVVTATGDSRSFKLELTSVQTDSLTAGTYDFWFIANKATAAATLRSGRATIHPDPTA
jgi:hypothetical protein